MSKYSSWLLAAAMTASVAYTSTAVSSAAAAPLGSSWSDISKLPDFFTGNWSDYGPMTDPKVDESYTPAALAYMAHYKPIRDIPYSGIGCKTPGLPIIQHAGMPIKFMYEPGMIAIYIENDSATRFIHLNAPQDPHANPTYLGYSTGHFEGDTLVIESTHFNPDIMFEYGTRIPKPGEKTGIFSSVVFGPHGPNMREVETLRLVGPDTLEDRTTIYDDSVFTKPYVATVHELRRQHGPSAWPREWQCALSDVSAYNGKTDTYDVKSPEDVLKELNADENPGQ